MREVQTIHSKEQIYRALRTIAAVAAAVALVMLAWTLLSPGFSRVRRQPSPETVSISAEQAAAPSAQASQPSASETESIRDPGNAEGTGEAGVMYIPDRRAVGRFTAPGFERSDKGIWYRLSENTCYYSGWKQIDGAQYHFDQNGYAAVGWKAISYQYGCYFDQNGAFVQDKDRSRMICLTFEGGPSEYTSQILDILSGNGVKATFFVSGSSLENYGEILTREVSLGNTIGNNAYSQTDLLNVSEEQLAREFSKTDQLIYRYANIKETLLARFPGGSYSKDRVEAVGKANILWDADSHDLETGDVEFIASQIYSQLESGSIIRLHDINQVSVEVVRKIVPELLSAGYEFVSINDMAASRGYELLPGVTYLGFRQSNLETGTVNDR